ncbi:Uncharacterized protein APZ42_003800 [Daphnia magna]|uniref:Cuticle protein n=1 Tax=Daphnia magna TaxID=35525 RepID=A0A164HF07_9CRUS|nr:Uncharacterized protein APZ42_003800 [Daphnia magna]
MLPGSPQYYTTKAPEYYTTVSYYTTTYAMYTYPAPSYPVPKYPTPSYPAPAYPAPAYPAPAYPTPSYNKDNKYADITITSQSDERNLDGSSQWSYAQSDYTTQSYGEVLGNTNKGSSYWVSPEGQKFTLTWAADEAGFQPKGDHLPVAPVHEYELPVAPVHIPFNGKGYKIY